MRQTADTSPTPQARALATREGAARLHTEDKTMTTYNGWTNYETWLVNLWLDEYGGVEDLARQHARSNTPNADLQDALKSYVEELTDDDKPATGLLADLIGAALSEVNWYELADGYLADFPADEDDDTEDDDEDTDD